MLWAVGRCWDFLITANAVVAACLIPVIMVSVSADVIGRYVLDAPIGWVIEFAEYALFAIPFLGMAWLVGYRDGHVRIDLLVQVLPLRWQARLESFTSLVAGLTCAAATWFAVLTTVSQYQRGVITIGIYPISKYLLVSIVAYGLACTTVELLRHAWRAWSRRNAAPAPASAAH
ncbi:MAG: TRAP transporter small permease [Candidatus Palauibacterales bacterium]|nr:TRAP transporter small permease [Candidatus Palauibacterales bacterium]